MRHGSAEESLSLGLGQGFGAPPLRSPLIHPLLGFEDFACLLFSFALLFLFFPFLSASQRRKNVNTKEIKKPRGTIFKTISQSKHIPQKI